MYRFHPSIKWTGSYPTRSQIVEQIQQLWTRYGLEQRTKFSTKVTRVYRDEKTRKWTINTPENGEFDGVMLAVGTCGEPKMPHIPGQEEFEGEIYHSSDLDGRDARRKNVVIIGGGASAVEALEFVADADVKGASVLSRVRAHERLQQAMGTC